MPYLFPPNCFHCLIVWFALRNICYVSINDGCALYFECPFKSIHFIIQLQEDGTLVSQAYLQNSLQPRTLFEGYCSLSYTAEPSWVTEFTFNVTNDGSRFTDSYNVHTYQSLCQEYQNTSGNVSFAMKVVYSMATCVLQKSILFHLSKYCCISSEQLRPKIHVYIFANTCLDMMC